MPKEFEMNNKWRWGVGIAVVLFLLIVPLFAQIILNGGYRMMNYSWQMPMMYGGGMMGFGMMLVIWLILLGLLVLIGLGIAWLVKTLTATK
jgi:hypothetical protein